MNTEKYVPVMVSGIITQIALPTDVPGYTKGILETFLPSDEEMSGWTKKQESEWIRANNERMKSICSFLNGESAATPPDVEQAKAFLIKELGLSELQANTLYQPYIEACVKYAKMYQAGQSAVQDATPQEWEKALISLTPGGSEYVGDPARCVEAVKYFRDIQHSQIVKLTKELSTLRSSLSAAQEENKKLRALGNSAITPPESGEQTK